MTPTLADLLWEFADLPRRARRLRADDGTVITWKCSRDSVRVRVRQGLTVQSFTVYAGDRQSFAALWSAHPQLTGELMDSLMARHHALGRR